MVWYIKEILQKHAFLKIPVFIYKQGKVKVTITARDTILFEIVMVGGKVLDLKKISFLQYFFLQIKTTLRRSEGK